VSDDVDNLLLDLDYPAPTPPPDLVPQLRSRARSLRRWRRVGGAAGAAVAVVLVATTLTSVVGGRETQPLPATPQVAGRPDVELPPAVPNAKAPIRWPDGVTLWIYRNDGQTVTDRPKDCAGWLPRPGEKDVVAYCEPAVTLAGDRFQVGFVVHALDALVDGHPTPKGVNRSYIGGSVGGPVTRIVVTVGDQEVEATLARDVDPRKGTYWAAAFLRPKSAGNEQVRWTVYSGSKKVGICSAIAGSECNSDKPNSTPTHPLEVSPGPLP